MCCLFLCYSNKTSRELWNRAKWDVNFFGSIRENPKDFDFQNVNYANQNSGNFWRGRESKSNGAKIHRNFWAYLDDEVVFFSENSIKHFTDHLHRKFAEIQTETFDRKESVTGAEQSSHQTRDNSILVSKTRVWLLRNFSSKGCPFSFLTMN